MQIGDVVARHTVRPDEVDLFLFSAASKLAHRIHYDADFARSQGLDSTPVHGPLQCAWITQLADAWARERGGRLVEITARNLTSVYPGATLTAEMELVEADGSSYSFELRLVDHNGTVATLGKGRVVLE